MTRTNSPFGIRTSTSITATVIGSSSAWSPVVSVSAMATNSQPFAAASSGRWRNQTRRAVFLASSMSMPLKLIQGEVDSSNLIRSAILTNFFPSAQICSRENPSTAVEYAIWKSEIRPSSSQTLSRFSSESDPSSPDVSRKTFNPGRNSGVTSFRFASACCGGAARRRSHLLIAENIVPNRLAARYSPEATMRCTQKQ